MATAPFKTVKFRIVFGIFAWSLVQLHVMVLHWAGFTFKTALLDSLISNGLLLGIVLLVITILQFYIPQRNRYGYILALCGTLAIVWLLVSRILLFYAMDDVSQYALFFRQTAPVRMAIAFLIICCIALLSVLWYTLQDQQENEKRRNEAERLAKEAELYKLRQQLQPHFLFNSLNSINALIGSKPHEARTMIQQLSDFLRGTLKKEEQQWISLNEELQHLQLYLAIEKVRFGHRLDTVVENEVGSDARLPAMLLQPIVENAIKFGLYDTIGAITIRIEARMAANELIITVQNPFDPATTLPRQGTGFGLKSVQRRLYLLFGRNDLLQTDVSNDIFNTIIKIPQPA